MEYDLSIVIPARNEMFLARTVSDLVVMKRGKTEILVGLDGEWADPPIEDHKDVTVVYYPEPLGQRAISNRLVKLSKAKYIMKIDAHCTVDEGFDVKMMSEMKDNYTMIPVMYNLHGFDWVCKNGHRRYQSPSGPCNDCGEQTFRDIIWKPRLRRKSEFYRFDTTLHFQYHSDRKKYVSDEEVLVDTMSAQGSCFMLTRSKWWELNISDEEHGSWGQQGTEVACKTWLSGGRLVTNRKTWYSHLFRTQGGDFGFPYPQSGRQVEKAREYSRRLFLKNTFNKQIYPLSWLIEKFKPLPDWHDQQGKDTLALVMEEGKAFYQNRKNIPTKGIIFYTDNKVPIKLGKKVRKYIQNVGIPIVSVSHKPMDFGDNYVYQGESGYLAYHKQILMALEKSNADIIYFCEHDVFYHSSHFDFIPPKKDVYYYNTNFWKIRSQDLHAVHYDTEQLNGLVAYRTLLIDHYRKKVARIEKEGFSMRMGFEPGCNNRKEKIDNYKAERYQSTYPILDIRYGGNLTSSRWSKDQFRNKKSCEGWKESSLSDIEWWNKEDLSFLKQIKSGSH